MKHDFHVGDLVYLVGSARFPYGARGTVCGFTGLQNDLLFLRMDLDNRENDLHSCNGLCEEGYGWTISHHFVRHVKTQIKCNDFTVSDDDMLALIGGLL